MVTNCVNISVSPLPFLMITHWEHAAIAAVQFATASTNPSHGTYCGPTFLSDFRHFWTQL